MLVTGFFFLSQFNIKITEKQISGEKKLRLTLQTRNPDLHYFTIHIGPITASVGFSAVSIRPLHGSKCFNPPTQAVFSATAVPVDLS